jgi:hypothetical protein
MYKCLFLCGCVYAVFLVFTHCVHQHEHEIFQMVNGTVIVVVILQEFVRVNQHVGHVFIPQYAFFFHFGYEMPCALVDVEIINQRVVQQVSQLSEPNLIHVANVVQQVIKHLLRHGIRAHKGTHAYACRSGIGAFLVYEFRWARNRHH